MNDAASEASDRWYQDAVIYQLHVRAFQDSNGDGIGDFRGLTQRLDYLQDLGVTAIWLLPFYPSPLKDDGYDIADYKGIHPSYGTMRDFDRFLGAAHERGLKVITELVINHTSDQHEWFQRARKAPPGSRERDFYVWSDSSRALQGRPDHLHRHRAEQLVLGPRRQRLLLAPVLLSSTRSQFRERGGEGSRVRRARLLARQGCRRAPARRRALTCTNGKGRCARTCPRHTPSSRA